MASSKQVDYKYVNETQIDEELKCAICKQPLQLPVSLLICHHTFCQECIGKWLIQNQSCPTCRRSTTNRTQSSFGSVSAFYATPFVAINTRIVLNQLDRLLVRCTLCEESNIQRCHFKEHEQKCAKKMVSCLSADIKCPWTGQKDTLETHVTSCIFQQVRPVIKDLQGELESSRSERVELKNSISLLKRQVTFLMAFVNKGIVMTPSCKQSIRGVPIRYQLRLETTK